MLDHLGLDVKDFERSKAFYERALAPLGISLGNNVEAVCHQPA